MALEAILGELGQNLVRAYSGREALRALLHQDFAVILLDVMAIADISGVIKQLNPSWQRTLGFSDEELRARPLLDFVHPDDREATGAQLEALRGGAAITYFENRFASKGGGYRWLGWTAA